MKFAMNPAPYVRTKNSTLKIMLTLLCGLGLVWLASIIYYFMQGAPLDGVMAILNVIICVVTAGITEILFFLPKTIKEHKGEKTDVLKVVLELLKKELNSFGYISGIILALLLPVGVKWWQLIFTTVAAISITKMLFGGFGYNIFNPAIFGRIFAQICFGSSFTYGSYSVNQNFEIFTGPTVLTNFAGESWNTLTGLSNVNMLDLLLGNYRGALGETFSLLIIIIGIAFIVLKVIDWRISCSYLLTCLLSSLLVGAINNVSDLSTFILAQMLTGGILFGAVFCLTDPVTSPTSPLGKIIFGTFAGFITMLIRFMGSGAEGVAYSILFANMVTPLIDMCFKGRTTDKLPLKAGITGGICTLLILVSCVYVGKVSTSGPTYQYEVTKKSDTTYNVVVNPAEKQDVVYIKLDMDVDVNASAKTVTSIKVNETGASDGYGDYFLGLVNKLGVYFDYKKDQAEMLENLSNKYVKFDTPVPFSEFRKYDLTYYDKELYTDFNDVSDELICGATYTVASYMFGVNRVIDAVEGK